MIKDFIVAYPHRLEMIAIQVQIENLVEQIQ
jgi:hypothetical protein